MKAGLQIYLTFCSAAKQDTLKGTGRAVPPDVLYTSSRIRRFVHECKSKGVRWAIFSDKYGVWFPEITHEYYDKSPDEVTPEEFTVLLNDFDAKLADFERVYFYPGTGHVHSLYKRILEETKLRERLRFVRHWWDIGSGWDDVKPL